MAAAQAAKGGGGVDGGGGGGEDVKVKSSACAKRERGPWLRHPTLPICLT